MTAPMHAEALVENNPDGSMTHAVEVTLTGIDWRMLVGDIAARVLLLRSQGAPILATLLAAGVRPCDADQQEALTELVAMLEGATHIGSEHRLPPTFTLTPKDASRLIVDLAEACLVRTCACGRAVESPNLTDCGLCTDRADLRVVGGRP